MSVAAAQHLDIRGKTEQRVALVVTVLRDSQHGLTYEDLQTRTGATYDSLLYILATLCEVGMVRRLDLASGPGRPKVHFQWIKSRRTARRAQVPGT